MSVSCECRVLSGICLCVELITRPEVCLSVIVKLRKRGGPGALEAVSARQKRAILRNVHITKLLIIQSSPSHCYFFHHLAFIYSAQHLFSNIECLEFVHHFFFGKKDIQIFRNPFCSSTQVKGFGGPHCTGSNRDNIKDWTTCISYVKLNAVTFKGKLTATCSKTTTNIMGILTKISGYDRNVGRN